MFAFPGTFASVIIIIYYVYIHVAGVGRLYLLSFVKKESIRKMSNFSFQWTKTFYQNNLNNISFFFTFFKGYRCNYYSCL